jgi:hypothetical protein
MQGELMPLSSVLSFFALWADAKDAVWCEFTPLRPYVLIDGTLSKPTGRMWRRRTADGWEYRQDAETVDEFYDRQW